MFVRRAAEEMLDKTAGSGCRALVIKRHSMELVAQRKAFGGRRAEGRGARGLDWARRMSASALAAALRWEMSPGPLPGLAST